MSIPSNGEAVPSGMCDLRCNVAHMYTRYILGTLQPRYEGTLRRSSAERRRVQFPCSCTEVKQQQVAPSKGPYVQRCVDEEKSLIYGNNVPHHVWPHLNDIADRFKGVQAP